MTVLYVDTDLLNARFFIRYDSLDLNFFSVDQFSDPRRYLVYPMGVLIDGLIKPLPLFLGIETTHPNENGVVCFAMERAADHHSLGNLKWCNFLIENLEPFFHLVPSDFVLAKFKKCHWVFS